MRSKGPKTEKRDLNSANQNRAFNINNWGLQNWKSTVENQQQWVVEHLTSKNWDGHGKFEKNTLQMETDL